MENDVESQSYSQRGPRIKLSDGPESIDSTRFHLIRIFAEKYKKEHVRAIGRTLTKVIMASVD